jgi:hypothetical protein
MTLARVVFFNGPPRSGKDTAAQRLAHAYSPRGAKLDRFALPIKGAFSGTFRVYQDEFGNHPEYEDIREEIMPATGVTYRQWLIDFSEKFMKPLYGSDIFGRLFVDRLSTYNESVVFVPDSGFQSEIEPVIDALGPENILLVRIHRPGFDFSGDSRSYIYDVHPDVREIDIVNDGTIAEFNTKVREAVSDFVTKPFHYEG